MRCLNQKIKSKKEAYSILKNSIYDENIFVMTYFIYSLSYHYGHWGEHSDEIPEEYNILIENDLFKLEEMILEKFKELLLNKKLLYHKRVSSILYYCYLISDEETIVDYLQTYIQKDSEKKIIKNAIKNHKELKDMKSLQLFYDLK